MWQGGFAQPCSDQLQEIPGSQIASGDFFWSFPSQLSYSVAASTRLTEFAPLRTLEVAAMSYPVFEIDWNQYRDLAENIWHAQMAGHPAVLTYNGPYLGRQNRKEALHFELDGIRQEILHLLSRDEYPFACTVEGGKASWVGHIPASQNSAQGGLIATFLRRNGIVPCNTGLATNNSRSKFEVRVTNYRPVVVPARKTSKDS